MKALQLYSVEPCMGNITADTETRTQAWELYEGLTGAVRRDYLKFSEEEATQFHDQHGALGIGYWVLF